MFETSVTLSSFAVISSSVSKNKGIEKCAKMFLKYCYTDESLVNFTLDTGTPKGVQYAMSKTDLNQLPPFQRSLFELKSVSDVIYPYSSSPIFINHQNKFKYDQGSKVWESKSYLVAYSAFKDNGVSAKDYFLDSAITSKEWSDLYSKYFK